MTYDSETISPETKARLDALKERLFADRAPSYSEGYPADVADTIQAVCELWNLRPPKRKGPKSYWIDAARDLGEACGEFGVECLREYRKDFEKYMYAHQGVAPHTVEGPGSLIKSVRAKAAQMRTPVVVVEERNIRRVE